MENKNYDNQRRWYVVQTYSGYENSIKQSIEKRIESMDMKNFIFQVMVPEEVIQTTKADGKKSEKIQKMYPGYVFVEMIVTDESWFIVRNTEKVTGFLGSSGGGTKPVPVPQEEIDYILKKIGKYETPKLGFDIGDRVEVRKGPFEGKTGEVVSINIEKGSITISTELFGGRTLNSDVNIIDVVKVNK